MTLKSKFRGSGFWAVTSALPLILAVGVPVISVSVLSGPGAAVAAVARSIEIRGNKAVDTQVIRDNLGLQAGRDYSPADLDAATKRLAKLGLFSNVSVRPVNGVLVVTVSEFRIVNKVTLEGNKAIKTKDMERVLSLKPREAFDAAKLSADEQTIREAYASVGRRGVTVSGRTEDAGQGRVNVIFTVKEGKRSKIGDIVFVGNKAFGSRRLRDVLVTKRSNMFSWLTKGDIYNDDRLNADEEALRRFYYNRGYADFHIVSSKADYDAQNNKYTLTFVVDEGALYHFGDINVESSVPGINTKSMAHALSTKKGDTYNAAKIEDSVLTLGDKVADAGYAFAKVEPITNRDFATHKMGITYSIEQGERAYIQRIEIRGNTKTRDQVIRREFDFAEGDAFSQTMVKRAKRRLEGLGFFQTVDISVDQGSAPDQVILVVKVAEKPTGEFSIGGGYTTGGETPGVSVDASITERNFLGRGQYVKISAGGGDEDSRNYGFSFTEPYFLGYRLAAGIDLFHQSYKLDDDYKVQQTGGSLRFGIPITERVTGNIAYNYSQEKYKLHRYGCTKNARERERRGQTITDAEKEACEDLYDRYSGAIIEAADKSPWSRSSVSYGLTYNSIDDMNAPHSGLYARVMQEYAGLGGDADFLKTTGKATLYKTLSERYDIVGLVSGGGGYLHGYGSDGLRVFDMFKNNTDMIRGFRYNGIGPRQYSKNGHYKYFLGGDKYMNATAEMQFPLPVVPESFGMRGAVFADAATLYGNTYRPDLNWEEPIKGKSSQWRSSAGISLMWASPFGPLRFDYAWPISKQTGDRTQNFNFGMSTKF